MRSVYYLAVATVIAFAQPALASGYLVTYQSGKLLPSDDTEGLKGLKRLKISWSIPSLPSSGKCYSYDWQKTIVSYTDGKNTMQSLLTKYVYNDQAAPFLLICIKRNSLISQESTFVLGLFTNTLGINYSEYGAYHSTAQDGRNSIVYVDKYMHSELKSTAEDESSGGKFTLSAQ